VAEIKLLIAERYPQPDLPARIQAIPDPSAQYELVSKPVDVTTIGNGADNQLVSGPVEARAPRPRVAPLSRGKFALQMTLPESASEKLRYIQALLGHAIPTGDLAGLHERAYDAYITQLEKQKFAATSRPHASRHSSADPRHVPAAVKRTVWAR